MSQTEQLTGHISGAGRLSGHVSGSGQLGGRIAPGDHKPVYTGDYSVIPDNQAHILLTKGKAMEEDVTVFAIPYEEVTNPQGGKTVTIGNF